MTRLSQRMHDAITTPVDEQTPAEKFIRLGHKRGEKFKHQCKLLTNLATSYAYTMNQELAEDLMEMFVSELDLVREEWSSKLDKIHRGSEIVEEIEAPVAT